MLYKKYQFYNYHDSVLALCECTGNQTDRRVTITYYNIHIEHIVHLNKRYTNLPICGIVTELLKWSGNLHAHTYTLCAG